MRIKGPSVYIVLLLSAVSLSFCDPYTEGEKYFRDNRPSKAVPLFEQAIKDSNSKNIKVNPQVYNLLGLCYYKMGRFQQAIDVFLIGVSEEDTDRVILYFNAGNAAYAMGNYSIAEQNYNSSIFLNNSFAPCVLNRANSRMKMNLFKDALDDYILYLKLEPQTPQKENIEELIGLLKKIVYDKNYGMNEQRDKMLNDEDERLSDEQENQKREKDENLKKEQERRRKLLEEISASLEKPDTDNFSAGSEGVMEYEQESKLD